MHGVHAISTFFDYLKLPNSALLPYRLRINYPGARWKIITPRSDRASSFFSKVEIRHGARHRRRGRFETNYISSAEQDCRCWRDLPPTTPHPRNLPSNRLVADRHLLPSVDVTFVSSKPSNDLLIPPTASPFPVLYQSRPSSPHPHTQHGYRFRNERFWYSDDTARINAICVDSTLEQMWPSRI